MRPLSVSEPAPNLVKSNAPLKIPLNCTKFAPTTFNVVFPSSAAVEEKTSPPVFTTSPRVNAPESDNELASVLSVVESLEKDPPVIVSVPEPRALLLPI